MPKELELLSCLGKIVSKNNKSGVQALLNLRRVMELWEVNMLDRDLDYRKGEVNPADPYWDDVEECERCGDPMPCGCGDDEPSDYIPDQEPDITDVELLWERSP